MKKIILVAALVLGFAAAAVAQPRALGLRGGYGVELSYQHTLGENFLEADLGLGGFNNFIDSCRLCIHHGDTQGYGEACRSYHSFQ